MIDDRANTGHAGKDLIVVVTQQFFAGSMGRNGVDSRFQSGMGFQKVIVQVGNTLCQRFLHTAADTGQCLPLGKNGFAELRA